MKKIFQEPKMKICTVKRIDIVVTSSNVGVNNTLGNRSILSRESDGWDDEED